MVVDEDMAPVFMENDAPYKEKLLTMHEEEKYEWDGYHEEELSIEKWEKNIMEKTQVEESMYFP